MPAIEQLKATFGVPVCSAFDAEKGLLVGVFRT